MGITTRLRRGLAAGVALAAATGVTAAAPTPSGAALPACTITWSSPTNGQWEADGGWSAGRPPTEDDHVCITVPGDYTVTVGDAWLPSAASIRVGAPSGTTTQVLHVVGSITVPQGVEVGSRGVLRLGRLTPTPRGGAVAVGDGATIANAGRIEVGGDPASPHALDSVVNAGTLAVTTDLSIADGFTNDGAISTGSGVDVRVQGTLWTRAGEALGRGTFEPDVLRVGDMDAPFSDTAGTGFALRDGAIAFEGDGTLRITVLRNVDATGTPRPGQVVQVTSTSVDSARLGFSGTWTNRAEIELRPSATLPATIGALDPEDDVFVNEGTVVRFPAAGALAHVEGAVVNRGLLSALDGAVVVSEDLRNEGTIALGRGEVGVGGDVVLGPGGVVRTDLVGGAQPDAGRLTAEGDLTVDGALVTWTSDLLPAPPVGVRSTVLTGASRTGTFDDVRFTGVAGYDVDHTATGVDLVRRAGQSATRRFVRAAFQDFLGRQPTPTELDQRAAALDGGTLTRASLGRELSRTPEYVTTLVQRFYADTLGRPGDPGGVAFWVDQLRTGRKTVAQVAGSFYASPEYFTRAGGTNPAWVTDLYDVFFGRPPSAGDLTYWTGRIATRGRTGVAVELFQSLESRRQRVERLYQQLLQREGDADGIDYWAGRITREGDLALAVFLAASGEYLDLAQQRYP